MRQLLLSVTLAMLPHFTSAQTTAFGINHGPYLQEVTSDGATIVFTTSGKSYSWVEVKPRQAPDSSATRHYNSRDGFKEAWVTHSIIRIDNLCPATSYDYRIVSKEMLKFEPYRIHYGDSVATPWYTITTTNPKQQGATLFVTSDMHFDAKKLDALLHAADYASCDAIFYAGDMTSYIDNPEAPYTSFIDLSTRLFATHTPFQVVRGNHETRGNMARSYSRYFPKRDGKIYGSYLIGDVMIVMLDCGEDKADSHPVYAGITDFDAYRSEQALWLKQLIKTKVYKKARYHIVISHFPMVMDQQWKDEKAWHGWNDAISKFLPILNQADIDLMVSGHTHRTHFHPIGADGNSFPVLEQGYDSAARLEIHNRAITYKIVNPMGEILDSKKVR